MGGAQPPPPNEATAPSSRLLGRVPCTAISFAVGRKKLQSLIHAHTGLWAKASLGVARAVLLQLKSRWWWIHFSDVANENLKQTA